MDPSAHAGEYNCCPDVEPPPAYSPPSLTDGSWEHFPDGHNDGDFKSTADHSSLLEKEPLIRPAESGEPGFATESALRRGLQVPTKSRHITSGFEYPTVLARYDIPEVDWARFTGEITNTAAMSRRQWTTAIGRGLGTFAVGGLLIGFMGAVPAVVVAKKVREHREQQNLAQAMSPGSTSSLPRKIELWNESYFKPRGIIIRVDLPFEDMADIDFMDVSTSEDYNEQYQSRRPSLDESTGLSHARTNSYDEGTARAKASRRGRIVIIPLDARMDSTSRSPSTMSLQEQDDHLDQGGRREARHQGLSSPAEYGRARKTSRYASEPLP
ncbi:hypothetical protein DTO027B5_7372 [Paecilomyces variotii]|nr:hypothetical protein DTO027B3_3558 [Paecilomyces variotii]KAJ9330852.1 hypothetical protein DTO027B5_7372 [Paecilomyces variotii]